MAYASGRASTVVSAACLCGSGGRIVYPVMSAYLIFSVFLLTTSDQCSAFDDYGGIYNCTDPFFYRPRNDNRGLYKVDTREIVDI